MRWPIFLTVGMVITGCTQPESDRTVAAFEVPLPTEADRDQFLTILSMAAAGEGMHVDVESQQDLENAAQASPLFKMTMNAAVWRGADDDEAIASAMDQHDHFGQVWVTFSRGKDPALSSRFRERALRMIRAHWPGTLSLPIMPTGAIPVNEDLIRTPTGYVVKPSEAYKYQLGYSEKLR